MLTLGKHFFAGWQNLVLICYIFRLAMPASKSVYSDLYIHPVSHSLSDQGCNYDVPAATFIVALNMLGSWPGGSRPFTQIPCWLTYFCIHVDPCTDFLEVWYCEYMQWALATHKIHFSSVPKYGNYGDISCNLDILISITDTLTDCIHIWYNE